MAGHSHWKQIQHKKGAADQKRSQVFSKLLNAIAVAAKKDANPQFNPRLRTAVEKAKNQGVPQENIDRAISKAAANKEQLEELTLEAYGPAGAALIIEAISDNRNRTIAEIKSILKDFEGKWAEPGSVRWAFKKPAAGEEEWQANFKQPLDENGKEKIRQLIDALANHGDVQNVYHNADL